jgi:hypothetical protein
MFGTAVVHHVLYVCVCEAFAAVVHLLQVC